jgi:hypothetical protein
MPFCSNCGSPMEGNFCAKCGTRTGSTATAGSSPPAATPMATTPGPGAPQKKKGPLFWILVVVAAFFVLTSIAVIGGGLFVVHKVKQAGIDPELIEKNPGLAAAKMIAAMNPDVEVVSTDEDSGTVTLLDKKSGETVTMNFEDVEKGRIVFEGKGGEKVEIQGQGEGSSGSLRVDSSEGSMVFGAGAGKLPAWLAAYPGAEATGGATMQGPEGEGGTAGFKTGDSAEQVAAFYEQQLKQAGMKTTKNVMNQGGEVKLISLHGADDSRRRTATIVVTVTDEGTTVAVTHQSKK